MDRKSAREEDREKRRRYIIAVDPSINTAGVAVHNTVDYALEFCSLLRPKDRKADEFEKSLSIFKQVRYLKKKYKTDRIVIEVPVHWEKEGFVARESGSIQKLMLVVGMIYTLGDVFTIPPHGWKKQLPKKVCHNRLMRVYPDKVPATMDHNVVDAVGIGHWYLTGKV